MVGREIIKMVKGDEKGKRKRREEKKKKTSKEKISRPYSTLNSTHLQSIHIKRKAKYMYAYKCVVFFVFLMSYNINNSL